MALCRASWRCGAAMALQRPGDVQGSELSGMRSTCLLGFKEPLVLFSDSLLGSHSACDARVPPHSARPAGWPGSDMSWLRLATPPGPPPPRLSGAATHAA